MKIDVLMAWRVHVYISFRSALTSADNYSAFLAAGWANLSIFFHWTKKYYFLPVTHPELSLCYSDGTVYPLNTQAKVA